MEKKAATKPEPPPADAHVEKLQKVLYIVGDDGDYYRITENELQKSFRVEKDDPNLQVLDLMRDQGVAFSGLDHHALANLKKLERFTNVGMWFSIGDSICITVHFLNLHIMMGNMPGVKAQIQGPEEGSGGTPQETPPGSGGDSGQW